VQAAADSSGSQIRAILQRLHPFIGAREWETRTAAGHAVEALAHAWSPPPPPPQVSPSSATSSISTSASNSELPPRPERIRLSFAELDMAQVIARGQPLLASGGAEFEFDWSTVEPRKRLEMQRQLLKQRLGLAEHVGIESASTLQVCCIGPALPCINCCSNANSHVPILVTLATVGRALVCDRRRFDRATRVEHSANRSVRYLAIFGHACYSRPRSVGWRERARTSSQTGARKEEQASRECFFLLDCGFRCGVICLWRRSVI
jgi:hypothetical protein